MSDFRIQAADEGCNTEFTAMATARAHFLHAYREWLETNPSADDVIEEADGTYSAMMQMRALLGRCR